MITMAHLQHVTLIYINVCNTITTANCKPFKYLWKYLYKYVITRFTEKM